MKLFTDHPETVGETYTQHMGQSFSFGVAMIKGGLCCLVHGFFPFLFEKSGSSIIKSLHHRMVTHRDRRQAADDAAYLQTPAE